MGTGKTNYRTRNTHSGESDGPIQLWSDRFEAREYSSLDVSLWTLHGDQRFTQPCPLRRSLSRTGDPPLERVLMLNYCQHRYRDVQCVWTQTSVMVKGKEIELPLLLLFSENRSYLEAYRVPSFSRVLNYYFPFPFQMSFIVILVADSCLLHLASSCCSIKRRRIMWLQRSRALSYPVIWRPFRSQENWRSDSISFIKTLWFASWFGARVCRNRIPN